VDVAVLIFVLSALHPDEWFNAVKNIHSVEYLSVISISEQGLMHYPHRC